MYLGLKYNKNKIKKVNIERSIFSNIYLIIR